MEDYFEKKANEIEEKIHDLKVETKRKCTGEDIAKVIKLGLKEVARDQRYACIDEIKDYDAVHSSREVPTSIIDRICGIVHNSQIK